MIHTFDSTGEAYDACQCDENVKKGDILLILSEKVVGIADTWPFAVSLTYGLLHEVADWDHPLLLEMADSIAFAREMCKHHSIPFKETT